jgi:surfeit locus 1 family protein
MYFRPLPILTLIAIPALVALVWLGTWQVQRAGWKAGVIAEFERAAEAAPASLEDAFCAQDAKPLGKVVTTPEVTGRQLRVFGHNAAGETGWRLFQPVMPACYSSTGGVLAEMGFEPLQLGEGPYTAPATPQAFTGKYIVEEWPPQQMMAAANAPDRNEWHWFDAAAMTVFLGTGPVDQRFILARLEGKPDYLTRTPPETHIGYAVTWFGMAIGFVVIYALFHARAGRLRFRKREPGQQ